MSNVLAANVLPTSLGSLPIGNTGTSTDGKMMLWKLTRVMKAAGWIYKSSGVGNTALVKNTSGNPNQDLWNGYGEQIPGQSGSTASFSSFSSGIVTVNGLTGMSASSVGRVLILSGAATANNNGVFRIVTFSNSTTVGIYNSNGSSLDDNEGSINWQEMDLAAYIPGQIGAAANITTVSTPTRIVTVTGLTGMTPLSTNRYLTITNAASANNNGTFKILSYISATSVTIINSSGVANDANNASIIWRETDPLLENYVLLQQNAWLCMQGPSTLRIPITSASTGTFLRGENIAQTTTGAQGEIIGYVFDIVASAGFLVVMPRVHGTGAGPLGWDTNLITGGTSSATVTPSANPAEFVREAVFFCPGVTNTTNAVTMWMQCIDNTAENASRFSVLQASAGCTAAVPPGGTGTGNAFPAPGTMVVMGSSTTGTNAWGAVTLTSSTDKFGLSHFMCADTTYEDGRSADGSFCGAVSMFDAITENNNGSYIGCLWTRCDAQEEGDIDPYVFYMPGNTALYSATRIAAIGQYTGTDTFNASSVSMSGGSTTWGNHLCRGWRRRGFASGDAYQNFGLFTIGHTNASGSFASAATGTLNLYNDPASVVNKNITAIGEPIWVISAQSTALKMRKGIMRWARLINTGTANNLYQGGLYIQLSSSLPAFIVGPWDKRTLPIK